MRYRDLILVLAACCFPWPAADGAGRQPGRVTRGPYVQMGTTHSMTVVWRTTGAIRPVVRYGLAPDALDQAVPLDAVAARVSPDVWTRFGTPRLHSAPGRTFQYEARITGLAPHATYYYAVYDGDTLVAGGDREHFFRTAPSPGAGARVGVWAVGDSGTGDDPPRQVYEAMRDYTHEHQFGVDIMLHLGDMAYWDGHDWQFQERFFDLYAPTLRQVVCWPTLGNHEGYASSGETGVGPYFDAYVLPAQGEAGGAPSGTEAYYAFDYGDIHFVVLDSYDLNRAAEGAMAQWLQRDLATVDADWLVAFWHHPPYSKGTHDSDVEPRERDMHEQIMPILEAAGVDVVLTGHSHIYERSMLMDGAYETPTRAEGFILDDGDGDPASDGAYRKSAGLNPHEGTVQVVAGNGGAAMFQRGVMPVMMKTLVQYGSLLIDVEGETLMGRMVDIEGSVRDQFAIVKRGRVERERLATPWQPVGPIIEPDLPVFLDEVAVTLRSATGWPDEEIRYTTDGREPTVASSRYVAPITVREETTIRARAFRAGGGRPSPSSAQTFKPYTEPLRVAGPALPHPAPGLAFDYYEGDWKALPDFEALKPRQRGRQESLDLPSRKRDDFFAVRYRGHLRLSEAGVYAFYLSSDDGSRLLVGDRVVVDNDGLHATAVGTGFIGLGAGYHPIEVQFFESGGAEVLQLEMAGPGLPRRTLGAGDFWQPGRDQAPGTRNPFSR